MEFELNEGGNKLILPLLFIKKNKFTAKIFYANLNML